MNKIITKTVVIISAVSVALGIVLCIAGASANGSLGDILDMFNIHIEHNGGRGNNGYSDSYSIGGGDMDDFFNEFFGDDMNDFFNDGFDMNGGENSDASL